MNTKNQIKALFVFCVILILSVSPGKSFAQTVTNGGFESSDVGDITTTGTKGWYINAAAPAAATFQIVSDTVQEGHRALKVTVQTIGTNQWDVQAVGDSIHVTPGATYQYTVWARSDNPNAQVNFTVGTYSTGELGAIRPATLTTTWKKFTLQFTAPSDQSVIRAPIHYSYAANVGKNIYVDNLQIVDINAGKKPVIVEAESGQLGSNYSVLQDSNVTYITPISNYTGLTSPGDTSRIATYQVAFADSGYYNLFVRMRVGPGAFNDDSFFHGKGFGEKNDTSAADWVFINGMAAAGFSDSNKVVNGPGTLGSGMWKWVNVTHNSFGGSPVDSFYVSIDSLSKTFQIGSREDGFDIDKIAFAKTNLFYTVDQLNKDLAGTISNPEADSSLFWKGPALATGSDKFLGNYLGNGDNSIFTKYWDQVTPANEGKWGSVANSQDTTAWNWAGLDRIYNYAQANHIIFKDHNLIWGQQQPSWISALDSATQYKYIETWIRMVGQRYPLTDMIDVVNEPLSGHNPPDGGNGRANYEQALGGNGTTGWDWVIKAFELARKYLPNTKLLINDYGIINSNAATTSYLYIINLLKDRNLIDGIGVQGHRFELESADTAMLRSNLNRLAATGLPVYISELDLGNIGDAGTPNDATQLQLYQKIFPILWTNPGVKGITLWGYLEGQMWQTTAFLVRTNGESRPAFSWLAQFVKNNLTGVENAVSTLPSQYNLEQNYPNPFNPSTNIGYSIANSTKVTLTIYDFLGREVRTLVNSVQAPGHYTVTFDGQGLASGVYFYRLSTENYNATKKFLMLK